MPAQQDLDSRVAALSPEIDAGVRTGLQAALRVLRTAGDPKNAYLALSPVALGLFRVIYAAAQKDWPSDNLFDVLVRAGKGDADRKVVGHRIVPDTLTSQMQALRVLSNYVDHAIVAHEVGAELTESALNAVLAVAAWFYCESGHHAPPLRTIYASGYDRATAEDLRLLRELPLGELCGLVVVPLLDAMRYNQILTAPPSGETSQDVTFEHDDPLRGPVPMVALVRQGPLSDLAGAAAEVRAWLAADRGRVDFVYLVSPDEISPVTQTALKAALGSDAARLGLLHGAALVKRVKQHLPDLFVSLPTPESRYLFMLCQKFLEKPTLGRLGSTRPLNILEVYTGGRIVPTTPEEARLMSFAVEHGSPRWLAGLDPLAAIQKTPCCAVIADVGSGKTTFMQKLVLDTRGAGGVAAPAVVPILLPLAEVPPAALETAAAFRAHLTKYCREVYKLDEFSPAGGRKYTLLLDGFDELQGGHDALAGYAGALAEAFTGVVVTSRPSRVPELPERFQYYQLLPFDDEDITEFLGKWFPDNPDLRDTIEGRLRESVGLRQFCRTPLILTLYSLLAGSSDAPNNLPARRTAIYREIVKMLLGEWDRRRSVRNVFEPAVKSHLLEQLAYDAHTRNARVFTAEQVSETARDVLRGKASDSQAQALVAEVVYRSSLVRQTRTGEYEFVHLSFQEYMAAERLRRISDPAKLAAYLEDDWWRGALLFYFGTLELLDGLPPVPKKKQTRAIALRLVEFLAEAVYTGKQKKREIETMVADQLLRGKPLAREELSVCARMGDDLIPILTSILDQDKKTTVQLLNYAAILRAIGSERANQALLTSAERFEGRPSTELLTMLTPVLDELADETAGRFAARVIQLAGARLPIRWRDQAAVVAFLDAVIRIWDRLDGSRARHAGAKWRTDLDATWTNQLASFVTALSDQQALGGLTLPQRKRACAAAIRAGRVQTATTMIGYCVDLRTKELEKAGRWNPDTDHRFRNVRLQLASNFGNAEKLHVLEKLLGEARLWHVNA